MAYIPIEDYGLIGDMHTAALVSRHGSIDWLCIPRFDSPAVFSSILDDGKGGRFSIAPINAEFKTRQFYWPETNILVTRFLSDKGAAELIDFMPTAKTDITEMRQLVRRITVVRGSMKFRMICQPAFDFGRQKHEIKLEDTNVPRGGALFSSSDLRLGLATRVSLAEGPVDGSIFSDFALEQGDSRVFILRETQSDCGSCMSGEGAETMFRNTISYWRHWISKCTYKGRWREMVQRSALALKLLTYQPTGAIVAAPTCSLPEGIGGERNWDYRYTWIRDSAFTLYAFLRLGFTEEAGAFMNFLSGLATEDGAERPLQIMYGIDGRRCLKEEILDHMEGYCGSSPVRIGNGAFDQLQLDIYGELLDAAYIYNKWGEPISYELWNSLRRFVNWVCDNWHLKDEGVWEVRGGAREFVYSKVMCWVAVDRGLRLANKRSLPADREKWIRVRDEIYEEIQLRGWSETKKSFVQSYDNDALDASNLLMPLVFFMSPTDPRILSTLDAILKGPEQGGLTSNSLVYRYNVGETEDGLSGDEGTFNICTFWLVEALTRAGRFQPKRLEEARLIFERMLGFANHLGLYAEETGAGGEALGNFPQAFTHLSLISAAFNLDRALSESGANGSDSGV